VTWRLFKTADFDVNSELNNEIIICC
jgi:hypothetical protein